MLKAGQFAFIRTSYRVYGLSISEIARKTGYSRNTIRKVLRNEHSGSATRKQQPMPASEGFAEVIDSWLEQDKQRPPKQRPLRFYDLPEWAFAAAPPLCLRRTFTGSEKNPEPRTVLDQGIFLQGHTPEVRACGGQPPPLAEAA